MRIPGTSWFWIAAIIWAGGAICLTPGQAQADWTYEYQDDFSDDDARVDSYFHSIFWPQGAFPPRQAYLYFRDTAEERELGFGDYNDDPAYLCYRFPSGSENSTGSVYGELLLDVRLLESSGYLFYQLSDDGVNWSSAQELEPGSPSPSIQMESVRGSCYVIFFGTGVLIDNLEVNLYSPSATIRVPEDFDTIQEAIDSARSGDIVEVAPDTYTGNGNWDIDFRSKAITVRSSDGPYNTTIDCTGTEGHRGFYFNGGEGSDSVLRGFTIVGATVPGSDVSLDSGSWSSSPVNPVGGGIYCEFSSPSIVDCVIKRCTTELGGGIGVVSGSPTIIDCVIEDCRAGGVGPAESGGRGAGIGLIRDSDATILHSQIKDNSGYYNSLGAGVYCWRSSAFFANCDISNNTAQGNVQGGGAYCGGSSARIEFQNCVISNNTAEIGGGLCAGASDDSAVESVIITNCTIAHNSLSGDWSASSTGGGIHSVSSNIAIRNSIVWYNDGAPLMLVDPTSSSPVLYSCIEGGYPGQGNIDSDPLFASSGGSDYHLQSVSGRYEPWGDRWVIDSEYSPCIDAGDPQDPLGAEPLTNGKRINMGAYGGTAEASKGADAWIYHVDKSNGSDYNSGLSRSDAYATIQKAVDEAWNGDTVMVWPGVYREEVVLSNKAITLQSADDAAVITAPSGFAFSFYYAESSNCVLRNFVITGCDGSDGGAIYLDGASPMLTNLTITNNRYGISAYGGSNPDIVNCILWNNTDGDLYQCRARYSCVEQEGAVNQNNGNISTDPLFADSGSGDYHLMSRYGRYSPNDDAWPTDSLTSPCIDAGDPGLDPGREQKPHGGRMNMGAYGGTPFASLSGWPSWGEVNNGGNRASQEIPAENSLENTPAR
ncbi:MAG: right-handed parallel beta-helix repeat-containing protein [Sedimentisphaerales bacterium]